MLRQKWKQIHVRQLKNCQTPQSILKYYPRTSKVVVWIPSNLSKYKKASLSMTNNELLQGLDINYFFAHLIIGDKKWHLLYNLKCKRQWLSLNKLPQSITKAQKCSSVCLVECLFVVSLYDVPNATLRYFTQNVIDFCWSAIKNIELKMEEDAEGEENSPILKEIPVYLSQTLADKLVLYQYPLEHNGLNTDNSNIIQCSIKENPHEIMLELERNTESSNYCVSKGEQIAFNVDGRDLVNKNPEDITFPRNIMDRQIFTSRSLGEQNYAVGVLNENEIHVTPLKTVALLRPSFKYIDKGDKRMKAESKELLDDFSGEEEEELKQITVKFARQESEKTRKAREKSFGYVSKMNSKGVWCKSNFYDRKSDKSEIEFYNLYCVKPNDRAKEIKMETEEILQSACNVQENDSSSSHGDSLFCLQKLPLAERVKKFLTQARLIQFSQLVRYLGSSCDSQDYLKVVQQVGVLVQGCWVVQSDIVFCKEIVPGGVSGSLMRAARDYILYLFTKSRTVTRQKILKTVKLPSNIIKEILEELSVLLPSSKEWEFMLQTDHDFIKTYPEITQRQYIKWEMRHEQLIENLKNADINIGGSSPAKHRRKSYRDSSFSSDNESGAESRRNSYQIAGPKIRRTKKQSISINEVNSKGETT